MGGFETTLELSLLAVLAATLVHVLRLQRAIAVLRQDRAQLDAAVDGFATGTRQAEQGLQRMREAAGDLSGQLQDMAALKDDLAFLSDRGTQVADRLEALVRAARPLMQAATDSPPATPVRSQAERDLLLALRGSR